ncbi:hypothetical protein HELRODRAFT_184875 [Helobdella robusta]|uniref:SUMO-activating enzyme subunit 1 n=1 Tax=Helobdella robusta TaxID=6412 RepID=T1FM41_HELRO|nr:hypothetical protein HELRODRAFT_184875 [Helobdella robusta]ESO13134.1 hypothetical protein HELRODRAFT_184875 [Helobdella robusta]
MLPNVSETKISEDEAKIYDRQIRLWGLEAQKRLRSARVLVIGLGGLGAEIAKNIILAGVDLVTFLDDKKVEDKDFKSQFFIRREHLGNNRAASSVPNAQNLNPMVRVSANEESISEKSADFFKNYDVICLTDSDWSVAQKLDLICSRHGIKLFIGGVFGFYGYMLSDLGKHEYAVDIPQKTSPKNKTTRDGEPETKRMKIDENESKTVKKVADFLPLDKVFSFDWSDGKNAARLKKTPTGYFLCKVITEFLARNDRTPSLTSKISDKQELLSIRKQLLDGWKLDERYLPTDYFEECYYGELSATCAVVGGIVGQEVIKVVSKRDAPHNNFFFFDGVQGCGLVDKIGGDE